MAQRIARRPVRERRDEHAERATAGPAASASRRPSRRRSTADRGGAATMAERTKKPMQGVSAITACGRKRRTSRARGTAAGREEEDVDEAGQRRRLDRARPDGGRARSELRARPARARSSRPPRGARREPGRQRRAAPVRAERSSTRGRSPAPRRPRAGWPRRVCGHAPRTRRGRVPLAVARLGLSPSCSASARSESTRTRAVGKPFDVLGLDEQPLHLVADEVGNAADAGSRPRPRPRANASMITRAESLGARRQHEHRRGVQLLRRPRSGGSRSKCFDLSGSSATSRRHGRAGCRCRRSRAARPAAARRRRHAARDRRCSCTARASRRRAPSAARGAADRLAR